VVREDDVDEGRAECFELRASRFKPRGDRGIGSRGEVIDPVDPLREPQETRRPIGASDRRVIRCRLTRRVCCHVGGDRRSQPVDVCNVATS
jgi:hypothetical protein